MVLGQVSSQNVWMDSVQDDVTDISDALLTAQSMNEVSVTCCQVRLGQFAKLLGSVHNDVTDISNALVAAESINNDTVTQCKVRLVRQMIGLNFLGEFSSGSFTCCQVMLGQVSSQNVWMDSVQDDVTDISDALPW